MSADVRRCDHHGFFEGDSCPHCEADDEHVVDGGHRRQLSKFMSGALRHFPDDAGLVLDDAGWTPFPDLVAAVESKYGWADRQTVDAVVATDPKGRFERDPGTDGDPDRLRAAYGHSVDVTIESEGGPVPDRLYHGTAPRNVDGITEEGLRPMNRQQVHLSASVETARAVGNRHASDPVVFEVDAAAMEADGHDIDKRGDATYTTGRVPPAYLSRLNSKG
ncbi:RNA 2'-phosphotransferase [Haloarcula salinisoli]|uniref:Probable RNA 2'-phosphotransferase n=1 Tax=Haloarcula salinisoli TaxID=2487746 RepID=A0A8J7YKH3_9EURY|nr:RNA 2'-phosphotransferase [Halomicroarcula salinisoli]MBX0304824.1 RNA 2'-phosphotransferase [Halomicroarcula salinisoli]